VNKDVVSSGIDYLSRIYSKEAPLTVTRVKLNQYLGMKLDYSLISKVQIKMSDYIRASWSHCHQAWMVNLPPRQQFTCSINKYAKILEPPEAETFHHYVAKLLFLCKRSRPDIQMVIAFLSTGVNAPDQDDSKNYGV